MSNVERVEEVLMHTRRDDIEVIYEVCVNCSGPGAGYEAGDGEHQVWEWRVKFGSTDRHCSGGAAFVEAARCQQRIADEVWWKFYGINADNRWFPASGDEWKNVQP